MLPKCYSVNYVSLECGNATYISAVIFDLPFVLVAYG